MNGNYSGVYRTRWEHRRRFYEGLLTFFHFSGSRIVGLETCTEQDKVSGGVYVLDGEIKGKRVSGIWWKVDGSQRGTFKLREMCSRVFKGTYNNHPNQRSVGNYYYSLDYLRGL